MRARGVLFAWVLLSGLMLVPATSAQESTSPNVVVIVTDDQRADQLAKMPLVNEILGEHGVMFDNAFASQPLCCPSRISILRGQYSHTTGIYENGGALGGWNGVHSSGLENSTLATWLDDAGYRTGLIGKYLNDYPGPPEIPPGWDFWRGGKSEWYGADPDAYQTHVLTDWAEEFIQDTGSNTPLFLYVSYFVPHVPATPEPQYAGDPRCADVSTIDRPSFNEADMSDKPLFMQDEPLMTPQQETTFGINLPRRQCRSLLSVDDGVGAIVQALEEADRLSNTLIVFVSDHGLLLGEHRIPAGKGVTYEEAARIPLAIRYDPLTAGQARVDQHLVLNIDLAPTIVDLLGLDVTPGCPDPPFGECSGAFDGVSLAPLLEDPATQWRDALLLENRKSCGVRTEGYVYRLYSTHEEELYDLSADPFETTNLMFEPSPDTLELRDQLYARLLELCSPPPSGLRFLLDEGVTLEVPVAVGRDDAEEAPAGRVRLISTDLELVRDDGNQTVGLRFSGISVPQGATMLNARVQFRSDETGTEGTSLTIRGQDVNNAGTFTTNPFNVSSRVRTSASVVWVPPPWTSIGVAGPGQLTPDLSPVIQEIVNRPGWSSGNALVLIITGAGRRTADSFEGGGVPVLRMTFQA